jgi:hypothetical protein
MTQRPQQNTWSGPVRSLHSKYKVKVKFINVSQRPVDLYWLDFNGRRVRYNTRQPGLGNKIQMNTFITHPWVVHDSETGQRLHLSGQPVCIPRLPPSLQGNGVGEFGPEESPALEQQEEVDNLIRMALLSMPYIHIEIHIPGMMAYDDDDDDIDEDNDDDGDNHDTDDDRDDDDDDDGDAEVDINDEGR